MHPLLLWNNTYFFGGIANFLLIATLLIAGFALLNSWLSKNEQDTPKPGQEPEPPSAPAKASGCTIFLLFAAGFVFLLFLLAQLLAS